MFDYSIIWKSVLLRIAYDLKGNETDREDKNYKKQAEYYLDSSDFKVVCFLAGLNHRIVYDSFKKLIK